MRCEGIVAVALVGSAAACQSGVPQWAGTVTDSAGIEIVSNTRDPLWSVQTAWTLAEELRIGSIDEEPEYQFGRIGSIAADADGHIYVLDVQGQHVKVFAPDGEYVRTVGGPGSGPGELGSLTQGAPFLAVTRGDTLVVPDMANQRVNRYAPDGSSLGSFPLDFQHGFPVAWQATRGGALAMQVRPLAQAGDAEARDAIVLLASDGTVTDTVRTFPSGKSFSFTGGVPEWHIFAPERAWALADDRHIVTGVNDAYRLSMYRPSGALERIVAMPFTLRPVTEGTKDAVFQLFEQAFEDANVPPAVIPQLLDRVSFGEFLPAFGTIQLGPAGSLWVQHLRDVETVGERRLDIANFLEEIGAPDWDVFDRSGRFLGVVTMPDRFAPRVVVDDRIYGVWRDDLDVQYVMRLRVIGTEVD